MKGKERGETGRTRETQRDIKEKELERRENKQKTISNQGERNLS